MSNTWFSTRASQLKLGTVRTSLPPYEIKGKIDFFFSFFFPSIMVKLDNLLSQAILASAFARMDHKKAMATTSRVLQVFTVLFKRKKITLLFTVFDYLERCTLSLPLIGQ